MSDSPTLLIYLFATLTNIQVCPFPLFFCHKRTKAPACMAGDKSVPFQRDCNDSSPLLLSVQGHRQHSGIIHVKGLAMRGTTSATRVVLLMIVIMTLQIA